MFSFSGLRNRKNATSPTAVAETTEMLSASAERSDGEKRLARDFTQLITTSTTAVEMVETFAIDNKRRITAPQSGVAPDSELDLVWEHSGAESDGELDSDWEHLNAADAHRPGSTVVSESRQVAQGVVNALIEDAVSLAEQLRQQEEERQVRRLLLEQNEQLEEKTRAVAGAALLLAKQDLQAETAEQKQAVPLVSMPVEPPRTGDYYLSHMPSPPRPYSTLFSMQALQASQSSDPELVRPEDQYPAAQIVSVKAGVMAARHKMDRSNGVFSVGQSQNPMLRGFFQCFLGVPMATGGLLCGPDGGYLSQNKPNVDSDEDVAQMARLSSGHW
jgi:hypothetical protein